MTPIFLRKVLKNVFALICKNKKYNSMRFNYGNIEENNIFMQNECVKFGIST